MPKKISQLREAHPADGNTDHASARPLLATDDPLHAVFEAIWEGRVEDAAEALRRADLPGMKLVELLATALAEWHEAREVLPLRDDDACRKLTSEIRTLERARPATLADAREIGERLDAAREELAVELDAKSRAETAESQIGALESYFPALFGRPASKVELLSGGLPPRTAKLCRDMGLSVTRPETWRVWGQQEPLSKAAPPVVRLVSRL